MRKKFSHLIQILTCLILFWPAAQLSGLDTKNVKLSGKLRFRTFHFNGNGDIPGALEGAGTKNISYSDLFFRNNLLFHINDEMEINTMLDVFTSMGETDGALGSSDLGFQARQLYLTWKLGSGNTLKAGFLPFRVSKGFYLANTGGGFQYEHELWPALSAYFYYIKAYDSSRQVTVEGIGHSNYLDSDIFVAGAKYTGWSFLNADLFYTYQHDNEGINDPIKKLHWGGASLKSVIQDFTLHADLIYNGGATFDAGITTEISAFLFHSSAAWQFFIEDHSFQLSGFGGGISGDINNSNAGNQFQSIGYAFGVASFAIDNGGGLSLFKNGAGLYYYGAGLNYRLHKIHAALKGIQFISYASKVTAGSEVILNLKYDHIKGTQFFMNNAVFLPASGYPAFKTGIEGQYFYEMYAGAQISY